MEKMSKVLFWIAVAGIGNTIAILALAVTVWLKLTGKG